MGGSSARKGPACVADIRFQSIEDGDLADLWYAMAGQALRYPDHFKSFTDALLNELLERRGESVNAWLDDRFRDIHSGAEAVQVDLNVRPEPKPPLDL
jgi:hypothetical protein